MTTEDKTAAPDPQKAMEGVVELARKAHKLWDSDADYPVGKILLALAGWAPGYDHRADALHAAIYKDADPAELPGTPGALPPGSITGCLTTARAIGGALFSFGGFLTCHPKRWTFSAHDDAAPMVDALKQFAALHGLDIEDPDVTNWKIVLPPMSETHHGLDTDERVFFYEQDFYVLSNFSSFRVEWNGTHYPTSEHAYQSEKFRGYHDDIADQIASAPSAHEAFKMAEQNKAHRRPDWDRVKVDTMRRILTAKAVQHEYVHRKLVETGDRLLIENSWRDDYWGWGPNRDGLNMLGRLWMEVRASLAPGFSTDEGATNG